MILPILVESAPWCGPATATFLVQFAGDPFDSKQNDVKVVFLGDKSQHEERPAYFDPALGGWRAILSTTAEGRYRPKLVRNGKDVQTEDEEGILSLIPQGNAGVLPALPTRTDRLVFDTGSPFVGIGMDLGATPTRVKVDAAADAGANWVRIVIASDALDYDTLAAFDDAMDEVGRRDLSYTLSAPANPSAAWSRYAAARFGNALDLLQYDGEDPWKRPASTATAWPGLFENRPGPFVVREGDASRVRALRTVVERSEWAQWSAPTVWKGVGAKGVAQGDRLILVASPNAKLTALPVADGTYDVTTVDPTTGGATTESMRVAHAMLGTAVPAERFFVLRRRSS